MANSSSDKVSGGKKGLDRRTLLFVVFTILLLAALIGLFLFSKGVVGRAVFTDVTTPAVPLVEKVGTLSAGGTGEFILSAGSLDLKKGMDGATFTVGVEGVDLCDKSVVVTDLFKGLLKDTEAWSCANKQIKFDSGKLDEITNVAKVDLLNLKFPVPVGVTEVKFSFTSFKVVKGNDEYVAPAAKDLSVVITVGSCVKIGEEKTPTECTDGKDNDCNTKVDCDDSTCNTLTVCLDPDKDGIPTYKDNCQGIVNPDQKNTDAGKTTDVLVEGIKYAGDACQVPNACGLNTVWGDKLGCQCASGFEQAVVGDIDKGDGCTKKVDIKPTQECTATEQLCGAFCTENTVKYCPASGSYKADLNGDGVYDGADADIVFKTRDSKSRNDCGLKDQAPCPYNENAFYVCDEGTYRVVGTGIIYMFGKLDYSFDAVKDKCPYAMENVPGAVK